MAEDCRAIENEESVSQLLKLNYTQSLPTTKAASGGSGSKLFNYCFSAYEHDL